MIWPETLLEVPSDGQWWVLHVKPKSEKALARRCLNHSSFFLPQCRRQRQERGRVRNSYLPIFPGYFFLFGMECDRIRALETNLVVSVLAVPNQIELIEDLKRIHRVIESGLPILPEERLQPGMEVTIIAGP